MAIHQDPPDECGKTEVPFTKRFFLCWGCLWRSILYNLLMPFSYLLSGADGSCRVYSWTFVKTSHTCDHFKSLRKKGCVLTQCSLQEPECRVFIDQSSGCQPTSLHALGVPGCATAHREASLSSRHWCSQGKDEPVNKYSLTKSTWKNPKTLRFFQFSCSVVSDSLQPHGLQHARLPCLSPRGEVV